MRMLKKKLNQPLPKKLYSETDGNRYGKEKLPSTDYLTDFQEDLSRVIHSNFFRRLQGKSQLFPAGESDFFRNRLTHSLEVASIGKAIAIRQNKIWALGEENDIDLNIIELSGLCHDAGHPPFGHRGEKVLFDIMRKEGGFEGNAQTIHLLSKLEKLSKSGNAQYGVGKKSDDKRKGLNLTARSLASLIKYDNLIKIENKEFAKGYYYSEKDLIGWVKKNVGSENLSSKFKTIECSIMDIADDIAYSTFDLVDALHARFIRVTDLFSGGAVIKHVAEKVSESLIEKGYTGKKIGAKTVLATITKLVLPFVVRGTTEFVTDFSNPDAYEPLRKFLRAADQLANNGYKRSAFARALVQRFIDGIEVKKNDKCLALSEASLKQDIALEVECLKQFVFVTLTSRSRVQVAEYRADHIIRTIFCALEEDKNAEKLLPDDFAKIYKDAGSNKVLKKRTICDFIAGMTDRYALEFYGRLMSQDPETIFKPI
jgi:dGTPase